MAEDSLRHVYGDCEVVEKAKASFGKHLGCELKSGLRESLLLFPANSPTKAIGTITFNYAVWRVRTLFLASFSSPPDAGGIIKQLVDYAIRNIPTNKHHLRETTVAKLAENPPPDVVAAYTDGSALGNPGPCGGGYTVERDKHTLFDKSIPLGLGDNNQGEMGALMNLMLDLISRLETNSLPSGDILIFTDSAGCVGYLERGWAQPTDNIVSRQTRALWTKLKKLRNSKLFWIRGHSGIPGNEEADRLAKIAAKAAKAALG